MRRMLLLAKLQQGKRDNKELVKRINRRSSQQASISFLRIFEATKKKALKQKKVFKFLGIRF